MPFIPFYYSYAGEWCHVDSAEQWRGYMVERAVGIAPEAMAARLLDTLMVASLCGIPHASPKLSSSMTLRSWAQSVGMEADLTLGVGPSVAPTSPGLPACCYSEPGATPAEVAYAAYNRAGTPEKAGLNYKGDPCPVWDELPENIREKWRAAALAVQTNGSTS